MSSVASIIGWFPDSNDPILEGGKVIGRIHVIGHEFLSGQWMPSTKCTCWVHLKMIRFNLNNHTLNFNLTISLCLFVCFCEVIERLNWAGVELLFTVCFALLCLLLLVLVLVLFSFLHFIIAVFIWLWMYCKYAYLWVIIMATACQSGWWHIFDYIQIWTIW